MDVFFLFYDLCTAHIDVRGVKVHKQSLAS